MKKKGVSPVVATVLLIAMVVVIGLIIFLWFRGMTQEVITKFGDENIRLACDKVQFEADYDSNFLDISNTGNVPIYDMKIKIEESGSQSKKYIRGESPGVWDEKGLSPGDVFSDTILLSGDEITLIPILMGTSKKGFETYVCDEKHGEII